MIRIAVSLVVLVLLTTLATAQGFFDADQLPKIKAVRVFDNGGVKDGCLPQPDVLKVEAELILRRSGIAVVETDDRYPHDLMIVTGGSELRRGGIPTGACTSTLSIQLFRDESLQDGSLGRVLVAEIGGSRSGPKGGFEQLLREDVNRSVSVLANEILKARQK
jgi:hypothetical protein